MGRPAGVMHGADRSVAFIERLTHTKGEHAGQPFALRPWQRKIVTELFRVEAATGRRRYRTALLMLPRKNGKTTLAAAMALYGLLGDREQGAEVYLAAADRDQASIAFGMIVQMIRNDPALLQVCEVVESQKRIVHRKSGSFCRAISSEAYTKHGYNASMIIADELHAWPSRELWDVLVTSQGARLQPLMIAISTAGYDRHSILYELYAHACQVRDKVVTDRSFLPVIYEAPKDASWTSERVWKRANPALADFRNLDEMRAMCARAQAIPAQENAFRRLYLNQWTEQASRWLNLEQWDACVGPQAPETWRRRQCDVGLDLSTTTDLTACVAVFDPDEHGIVDVLPQFFVPQARMAQRATHDRVPYPLWADQGYLRATPGDVVDYDLVRQHLHAWDAQFSIRTIAYDPWNATDLVTRLEKDGFTCVPIRQGFASLSSPTKALERMVVGKTLRHDGHPVLRWNVANVSVEVDAAGNLKPSKKLSTERIDGVLALIMGLDRLERSAGASAGTVYEHRDLLIL